NDGVVGAFTGGVLGIAMLVLIALYVAWLASS
ncbi:MAG: hypothetical protein RI918_2006, partial [Pseudomonadota bacterium]